MKRTITVLHDGRLAVIGYDAEGQFQMAGLITSEGTSTLTKVEYDDLIWRDEDHRTANGLGPAQTEDLVSVRRGK